MYRLFSLCLILAVCLVYYNSVSKGYHGSMLTRNLKQTTQNRLTVASLTGMNSISFWPWDGKNKTHEDTSCSTHIDCQECSSSSSFCHWCSHDHACHAKGSIHGCFEGETCKPPSKENSTCASHTTCSECALSSSYCHWCAHDNMCHAVGSIYGCVTGVDCYSNDLCQRFVPEDIDGIFIEDIGIAPLAIIFSIGICCCCCATLCFCGASGFKGAYDDIVVVAAGGLEQPVYSEASRHTGRIVARPPVTIMRPTIEQDNEDQDDDVLSNQIENIESYETENNDLEEETSLLGSHLHHNPLYTGSGYSLMTGVVSAQPSAYATVQARGGTNSMQRIFNMCRCCYVITLIFTASFIVGSIRYFPKVPTYNVCNDNLAWKSIVDNMTSLKVEATFEILISVMNPNNFGVAIDMGRGTFNHRGVFVGTFDIPPTTIPSMSLMDIRVIAHFTPEKWEALSLTAEYYKGTLAFDVDAKATFRFPWLFDYSATSNFNDIHVLVNDPTLNDRHLCACPKWSDLKNKSSVE